MSNSLYEQLIALETKYVALSLTYEKGSSFEMAFLSLWSILEQIMKLVASVSAKRKLEASLLEWTIYVQNPSSGKKPKEIKNFQLEYDSSSSIPMISQIEDVIGNVPKLKELMDSNGKYRRKRNDIAHRAEKLSDKVYLDYKEVTLAALNELKVALASF